MPIETKRWPEDAIRPYGMPPTWDTTTPRPWYKKINPIWWFMNDEGVDPTYQPSWPQWRRVFYWYVLRNPLWNFKKYVIGVQDRHSLVTGPHPVFWPVWSELGGKPIPGDPDQTPLPASGWKNSWLKPQSGLYPPLPFISWSKGSEVFYLGWQPAGGLFGIKTNGLRPIIGLVVFLAALGAGFWWLYSG